MSKIESAISIIRDLGFPKEQQNERSALVLLALLNLDQNKDWADIERPMLGITPMMHWFDSVYSKRYAPNTRETIRRQTLHQFVDGGICLYNPDKPDRAVNSPNACYQIAPDVYEILKRYETPDWPTELSGWLSKRETLIEQYAMERAGELVPLTIREGYEAYLSPGEHSRLIRDIVEEFAPRFVGGACVVYVGDTGAKESFLDSEKLRSLGVSIDKRGKLPDVILYLESKDWLILVESVTSHGPVDGKRYNELCALFSGATAHLIFVTAFPNRSAMARFLPQISWETEVWIADAPSHMIHFNGDKFIGPALE